MSNITPVPSLSSSGWITDPSAKADALLAYFYESMKSQTLVYGSNVSSLSYLIQQYGDDPAAFASQLQSTLEAYLNRYYSLAIVTINSNADSTTNKTTLVEYTIHCSLTDGGVTYSMGSLLKISNSKVMAISKVNNG